MPLQYDAKPPTCRPYVLHNRQVWTCPCMCVWGGMGVLYIEVQVEQVWTCLGGTYPRVGQGPVQTREGKTGALYGRGRGGPWMVRSNALWVIVTWAPAGRHYWKHYLAATSLAGGNKCHRISSTCYVRIFWTLVSIKSVFSGKNSEAGCS